MALADQLSRIKKDIPDAHRRNISLSLQKKESDILFFQQVASALSQFKQSHSECYREHASYFKYFAGESSRNFRRDRLTQKENQNISQRIRLFISVLVPYAAFSHAKILLDWVIRRLRADVHEFQHVFLFAIASEEAFGVLLSQSKGLAAQGMSEFKEVASRGYSTAAISRALGRSAAFARIAAETLKLSVTDSCASDLLIFYAGALDHIFRREDIPDSVVSVWVPALLKKREALVQCPTGIIGQKMVGVIESLLSTIYETSELIEEYAQTIRSFGAGTGPGASDSQVYPPSLPFGVMYRQYKSTNRTEDIVQGEHTHAFILQLSRDCNTEEKTECISKVLEEEMRKNPAETAKLLLQGSTHLLEIAQATPADAKTPLLASIIHLLSGASSTHSDCIPAQALDEILRHLPHARLEHALIRYATKKDAVPGKDCCVREKVLMHVSPEVLMEEVSGRTSWEEAEHILSWSTVKPFTKSIAAHILSTHFPEYLDATSPYPEYTGCAYRFDEINGQREKTREKAEQYIRSRIQREITQKNLKQAQFLFALDEDFSLGTVISLVSLQSLMQLPKKEKLAGIKMVLRHVLHHHQNAEVMGAADIFDFLEAEQDAESTCLFFRCFLLPGFIHPRMPDALHGIFTGTPAAKHGDKLNEMAEYIHREHPSILPVILGKHTWDFTESQCTAMILSGCKRSAVPDMIRERVPGMSQDAKRRILGAALEMKEKGERWLFDQIVPLLPASDLFSIADTSRKDGIRLCLSAIGKGCSVGQDASDASLDVLLLAWKRKLDAEEIAPAISAVIGSRTFPDLISQRLNRKGKRVQRMISLAEAYLEKHKPETLLLSCARQLKSADTGVSGSPASISAVRDVLIRTLAKIPSTPSQVLALRVLLTCKSEEALFVSRKILENTKSSRIRYFVQSKLIRILHFVLPRALQGSRESPLILANLIRREKSLLGAYAPQLVRAVEVTRSVPLLNAMSYLEIDHLIGCVSVTRPHLVILMRYVKKRAERSLLEPGELDTALSFYLAHAPACLATANEVRSVFAKSVAQVFVLHEQKHSIWPRLIKVFGGPTAPCLTAISRVLDAEKQSPVAAPALSQVYGRMEQELAGELKNPTEKYAAIAKIMRRYYSAEADTMVDHMKILHLALERRDATAISLLPPLFSSRFRHRHSDADEMHHVLLRTLVQAREKSDLFRLMGRVYRRNKSHVLSLLRQSAPYYSALLEHKEKTVRDASAALMRRIRKYAGEDPYRYM